MTNTSQRKPRARARLSLFALYVVLVVAYSVYVLLDSFVIVRTYASATPVATESTNSATSSTISDEPLVGDVTSTQATSAVQTDDETSSAKDANTTVEVSETRYENTSVYVVDIYTDDPTQILTAFANNSYGKNVTQKTSAMAEAQGATVAINGDYYGARNAGYVVRNGVLYRDQAASASQEDLVIYTDGSFEIILEGDVSAQELVQAGAWQVFSFGPALIDNDTITIGANDEVGRAMASNPRTAIGRVSDGHYVLVVSDGRTSESQGLSLLQLATFMQEELGVSCAYNLDGGGSSTLWYEGELVNNPTTSGRSVKEREVSDIVYIAL